MRILRILYYEFFVTDNGGEIIGAAEKVSERSYWRKFDFERDKRVHLEFEGRVKNNFLLADHMNIFLKEHGRMRESNAIMNLKIMSKDLLKGDFYSSAANAKGTSIWKRN